MTSLTSVIERIIQTGIDNVPQASTMLANLHCKNIALCEFRALIGVTDNEGVLQKPESIKGTRWINTDVDPQVQVFYGLLDLYGSHPKEGYSYNIELESIIVEGIDEWEFRTKISTITDESSNSGPTEVDLTEPGESDGVLSIDED